MEKKLSELSLCPLYEVKDLTTSTSDPKIRVRGFVLKLLDKGKHIFISLRDNGETIQCVASRPTEGESSLSMEEYSSLKKVNHESFVELAGVLHKSEWEIKGCTKRDVELHVSSFNVLSAASQDLPFTIKDASRALKEREDKTKQLPSVAYNICLDNRALDLRVPRSRAIFRIVDGVMFFFRSFLRKRGFVEIKTSKLIESSSEGGANLFGVDFFGRKAYLAQSPQLYKQMAIIGGMKRVYEIGHVYRAEKSNINRYLSEFIGLDIEMEIATDYVDVIRFIHSLFVEIFDGIESEYSEELATIREFFESKDPVYPPVY
jgi:aspartyl-tRNA synthetase